MPATTITINREQRDGLYELVRNHLGSVSDLFDALEHEKDFGKAERLGLELIEDLRLMQDLGWGEDEGREGVELTMQPHDLMELLERLRGEAGLVLGDTQESREDAETMQRFKQGYEACGQLLATIDPREQKQEPGGAK
ncbi:MAG TPA: hypothetical protein VN758_10830 [Solirubrobacterales bacterium]|nr:hypothetical protein [Solirubrobacterales bacterium]